MCSRSSVISVKGGYTSLNFAAPRGALKDRRDAQLSHRSTAAQIWRETNGLRWLKMEDLFHVTKRIQFDSDGTRRCRQRNGKIMLVCCLFAMSLNIFTELTPCVESSAPCLRAPRMCVEKHIKRKTQRKGFTSKLLSQAGRPRAQNSSYSARNYPSI